MCNNLHVNKLNVDQPNDYYTFVHLRNLIGRGDYCSSTMATKGQWEEYVDAYHKLWDYLEQHEELLQWKGSVNWVNVNKVCDIMEECSLPVNNCNITPCDKIY